MTNVQEMAPRLWRNVCRAVAVVCVLLSGGGHATSSYSVLGTTYWRQALVTATYMPNGQSTTRTTTELAAYYSSGSKIATGSSKETLTLTTLPTSPGLCNISHTLGVRPGAPMALLARSQGCDMSTKIDSARRLGASVLLVYERIDSASPYASQLPSVNPLKVSLPFEASLANIQSIGIAASVGKTFEGMLLNSTAPITITITGRPDHNGQLEAALFLAVFSVLLTIASGLSCVAVVLTYATIYIQTRRLTLSQRSRADMARDALDDLPERTLDESHLQDGEHVPCVVCIDDLQTGDTVRTLPCNHIFHKSCIDQWLIRRQTCPLCKFNILTGVIDEEEELNVQDAANEISRGSLPPSVLGEAAALPLPQSRLSMFLDPGRRPGSGSQLEPLPQARSPMLETSMTEDSASISEVVMLDRSNSMLLSPAQCLVLTTPAGHTRSALGSHSLAQPEVVIRPNTSNTWRVAFSNSGRGTGVSNSSLASTPEQASPATPSPARRTARLFARMLQTASRHSIADHSERRPLSEFSFE